MKKITIFLKKILCFCKKSKSNQHFQQFQPQPQEQTQVNQAKHNKNPSQTSHEIMLKYIQKGNMTIITEKQESNISIEKNNTMLRKIKNSNKNMKQIKEDEEDEEKHRKPDENNTILEETIENQYETIRVLLRKDDSGVINESFSLNNEEKGESLVETQV